MGNIVLLLFCFGAGILLRRTRRMPDNASAVLNAFIINIGLPAMALGYLHGIALDGTLVFAALMPWILFCLAVVLLWPTARLLGLPRRTTGCVILVGGLANTSFVGIPMIEAFYGPELMSVGIVINPGYHGGYARRDDQISCRTGQRIVAAPASTASASSNAAVAPTPTGPSAVATTTATASMPMMEQSWAAAACSGRPV